jgi:hypothetical protein
MFGRTMPPPKSGAEISNSMALNMLARVLGMEAELLRKSVAEMTAFLQSPESKQAFTETARFIGTMDARLSAIEDKLDFLAARHGFMAPDRAGIAADDRPAADAGSDGAAMLDPLRIVHSPVVPPTSGRGRTGRIAK